MSSPALRIGVPRGAYPERVEPRTAWLDRMGARAVGPAVRWMRLRRARNGQLVHQVEVQGRTLTHLGETELRTAAQALRGDLHRQGFTEDLVARSFALVREAASRTIGERHYDVQLLGGQILLDGMVAEMETGEGKTLTATLPACTAALAGLPVHIVTVNDYLASRDAEWMGPVYRALGLTLGVIIHGMDPAARRAAYACDVTYCTNKEVAFDYLRDRIVLRGDPGRIHLQLERLRGEGARWNRLVLRGLYFAIVDEADSVLVDEARTPLIISGGHGATPERRIYETALALAGDLEPGRDFVADEKDRLVRLTEGGQAHLEEVARSLGGLWTGRQRREELVRLALSARHLFLRDKHYLVRDGKVQIIDEYTGRIMADRSWEQGLHQMIEAKEDCQITGQLETLARISYQRFFRRYLRLAGMTGTAREVAGELWSVYRLPVVRVATNRPLRRSRLPAGVYLTSDARWQAVVARVARSHQEGRPVLVGTRSVAASEHLSQLLTAAGLPHRVLNARQDKEEAEIIAQAGQPRQITVATNMAGRGTDIRLGTGVADLGGLHVIATERHEAGRIDRQLFGRCGRQGDPGSYEAIVSLEDEIVRVHGGPWRGLAVAAGRLRGSVPRSIGGLAFARAQGAAQRLYGRVRRDLLKMDEHLESALAFSGRPE